jgi:hypothetical protein
MSNYTVIAKKTFTAQMVMEGSFGAYEVGAHESTMELLQFNDGSYSIEWDIPALDETYGIGLELEVITDLKSGTFHYLVTGYDGIMSLPSEAIQLLEENRFDCSQVKD